MPHFPLRASILALSLLPLQALAQDDGGSTSNGDSTSEGGSTSDDDPSEGGRYLVVEVEKKRRGGGGSSGGARLYIPTRNTLAEGRTPGAVKPLTDDNDLWAPGDMGECLEAIATLKSIQSALLLHQDQVQADKKNMEALRNFNKELKDRDDAVKAIGEECSDILPDPQQVVDVMVK